MDFLKKKKKIFFFEIYKINLARTCFDMVGRKSETNNIFLGLTAHTATGFQPGMYERGGPKRVGGLGILPQENKIKVFKFWCSKWPILPEMTVKYEKKKKFLPTRGGYPPCGAEWGVWTPPDPPPPPWRKP